MVSVQEPRNRLERKLRAAVELVAPVDGVQGLHHAVALLRQHHRERLGRRRLRGGAACAPPVKAAVAAAELLPVLGSEPCAAASHGRADVGDGRPPAIPATNPRARTGSKCGGSPPPSSSAAAADDDAPGRRAAARPVRRGGGSATACFASATTAGKSCCRCATSPPLLLMTTSSGDDAGVSEGPGWRGRWRRVRQSHEKLRRDAAHARSGTSQDPTVGRSSRTGTATMARAAPPWRAFGAVAVDVVAALFATSLPPRADATRSCS